MDLGVLTWIAVPLAVLHLWLRRRRDALVFQVLLDVALLIWLGPALGRGLHLGPGVMGDDGTLAPRHVTGSAEQSDLPLQFHVWWSEVARLASEGAPPWISDRIGGGTPLFANGQSGVPFPLQAPVWALGPERGTDVMAAWKFEIAGLGTFLLLRRVCLLPAAAATGALAYAFGLYTVSWLVVPLAWVVAAAPWAFGLLIGALRGRRGEAACLALLLGVLAGWSTHPETAAFLALSVAVFAATVSWGRLRRLRRVLLPAFLAVLVAALGALPTILTVADSSKAAWMSARPRYPAEGVSGADRLRAAALLLVPWRDGQPHAGTWRRPFPNAAVALGVGTTPVLLILLGRFRRRHRRLGVALGAVGVGAACLAYQIPGIAHLAARFPVLGLMTWSRCGFLVSFAIASLGALAADAWLRAPRRRRLIAAAAALQVAVLALGVTSGHPRAALGMSAWLPAALSGASPLLPLCGGWALPAATLVGAWLDGAEVLPVSQGTGRGLPEALQVLRGGGRVVVTGETAFPANLLARAGAADLRANDPVRSCSLARLHHALGSPGEDLPGPVTAPWPGLSGAWGVRWLVLPGETDIDTSAVGWVPFSSDQRWRVLANPRALPVLRIVSGSVPPPAQASAEWDLLDFSEVVLADEATQRAGRGHAVVIESRPWRWRASVEAEGPVLAVLHVPAARGWRVWLDGSPARCEVVDLAAMGVEVPGGVHEVRWQYEPPGFRLGALGTILGLAGCLMLAASGRRPR